MWTKNSKGHPSFLECTDLKVNRLAKKRRKPMSPKKTVFIFFLLAFLVLQCKPDPSVLEKVMSSQDPAIERVRNQLKKHEVQIILTELKNQEGGQPEFVTSSFQLDEQAYFYPASTAKLPIAALTLQRLNELKAEGIPISARTPFEIRTPQGAPIQLVDSTQREGKLTFAHLIKKIFLVSDNDAYNYLFDFLGRDYINQALLNKGLKNTQIFHKFLLGADNSTTWEYIFFDKKGDTLYHQKAIESKFEGENTLKGVFKGKGFVRDNEVIQTPMDFRFKNRISLLDLEGILKRLIYPEVFSAEQQFHLAEEDLEFLRFWMSRSTLESSSPNYNDGIHWDSYGKFFIYGDQKGEMTDQIRIYNKVGYAYGTLTDVAYIEDKKNELSFFLTATVLVNENEIFNDDTYEFDAVGIPFLAHLGRLVLAELQDQQQSVVQ